MSNSRPSTSKAPYTKAYGQRDGAAPRPRPTQANSSRPAHFNKGKAPARNGDDGRPAKGKDTALILANTILTSPPDLALHPNLHKLDLSNCGLTSLAFVREARRTLTWLNVSGNNLRAPEAWEGVNELGGLFVLNASNCQLVEIPSVVEVLHSLKALVVTHNKLKTLDHVKNLAHLNTIVVSNNQLDSLPSTLTTLPSLKKISAAHNLLTVGALPDLTSLSHLREVKLNDNPKLASLPAHFRTWGKKPLPGTEQSKRAAGLEIVDLGNCGFEDWFALKELGSQGAIVNLGLKGTKVAEEAKAEGFEEFKGKLTILLPKLRILDGQRFDPKFLDLKARRDARAPEQRVLDAGPMGLAINAAKEKPVEIPTEMIAERERLKREREIKKKRKYMREQEGEEGEGEKAGEEAKGEEAAADGEAEMAVDGEENDEEAAAKAKAERRAERARKRKAEAEAAGEAATDDAEGKKKKRKNRHDARRDAEVHGEAPSTTTPAQSKKKTKASTSSSDKPTSSTPSATPSTTVDPAEPPPRKRGRVSKDPTRPAPAPRAPRPEPTPEERPRKRKEKGGVLAALKGDDSEAAAPSPAPVVAEPAPIPAAAPEGEAAAPSKQKTSVLKVVEVQKKKDKREKVDVGSLLGLGAPSEKKEDEGGLFGAGGGWD